MHNKISRIHKEDVYSCFHLTQITRNTNFPEGNINSKHVHSFTEYLPKIIFLADLKMHGSP